MKEAGVMLVSGWKKKKFDWSKREQELIKLFSKYKSKNNEFDCVVPVSGGKDGSYIAHTLKHKYKMNPLAINVTPPLPLKLGEENLKILLHQDTI